MNNRFLLDETKSDPENSYFIEVIQLSLEHQSSKLSFFLILFFQKCLSMPEAMF